MSVHNPPLQSHRFTRFPLLRLLYPRDKTRLLVGALTLAILFWGVAVWRVGMPLWGATSIALALLLGPAVQKWRDDLRRYGQVVMVLSVLLAMQSFHTLEHTAQMIQYHLLNWAPFASSGLISAANAEWVHFAWNWVIVAAFVYLMRHGMRGFWAWALLVWAIAHSLEHTYMLVRYYQAVQELKALGIADLGLAQGLPGVLGRDGWLAYSGICGRIPGLTTASRVDVHFWWNVGEIVLLLVAAHPFLKERIGHHSSPQCGQIAPLPSRQS